jgi:transposase-like protein
MMTLGVSTPFPCPFCRSDRVKLVGGGRQFVHYRCCECAEVWTALNATTFGESGRKRARRAAIDDEDTHEVSLH